MQCANEAYSAYRPYIESEPREEHNANSDCHHPHGRPGARDLTVVWG